jgi:Fe-S cluster assembly protein SufD
MSAAAHSSPPASPALRSFEAQWASRSPDALSPLRAQAMQRFLALGLPGIRDETWRYTNLRSLAGVHFVDAPDQERGTIEPFASVALLDRSQRAATVLMVNGHPWLHTIDSVINDIEVKSLKELFHLDPKLLLSYVDPISDADERRFDLLNTALFIDGLHLKVTTKVTTPLVILHVGIGADTDSVAYPRLIIDVAPGASATIIEHYVSQGPRTPLINSNTHVALNRGAQIEHYRVFATAPDATHIDSLNIRQAADSRCQQFTIALGGGLVRANLDCALSEPGASLDSHALLVGHDNRHVDCVNNVRHVAPHTTSKQTARAIASDTSRVIFNSKVVVNAGAEHAESQQSCRGLLLSQTAEIDTRPQLEIHAHEVKCAHGATTGRLDPDMLFYLLSRGLDRNAAQSVLVFAFLADVLTGMSVVSARKAIENALISQLPDSHLLQTFR